MTVVSVMAATLIKTVQAFVMVMHFPIVLEAVRLQAI
jgi:hypothetical protein